MAESSDNGPSHSGASQSLKLPGVSPFSTGHAADTYSQASLTQTSAPQTETESQPPYVAQFSSTTSLILERMKNGPRGLDSALSSLSSSVPQPGSSAFEEARNRLVQSMNTTLPTPTPKLASPASPQKPGATPVSSPKIPSTNGLKRKRDADKVDFTQNTMPFPSVSKSKIATQGDQASVSEPRMRQNVNTCTGCGGRGETLQNPVLTCHLCLHSWHKHCGTIVELRDAKTSLFECPTCKTTQEVKSSLRGKVSSQRLQDIERLREKRFRSLPSGVVPAKAELVGFGAGRTSNAARTEYFSSMKKTDMLNILSFCDQLKPQLLVDVLVSVSRRHPDLPMFSSPDWESQTSGALRPNPNLAGRSSKSEGSRNSHSLINSKARNKQKATKKILKRTRVIEVSTDVQDEDDDVLPSTWPKAGAGLYSKLPPETEDRELLADENDEESFSHFMVDNVGKQVVGPVGA